MWCLKGRVELKAIVDGRSVEISLLLYVCNCKQRAWSCTGQQTSSSRQCCSCHDSYARWENQAMHSGLTPLITRTASTNHACILYADMFAHSVLTHTNTRVPCLKCSMQLWHWHMPYLCISIKYTGHIVSQLCKWEQPTYGDRACIWVSESKAIFSEDIMSDKPLDLIILVILLR